MSFASRHHLCQRRACRDKRRLSEHDAKASAARATKLYGVPLQAYHCGHCGQHHIGNVSGLADAAAQERKS